jgi:hypothetical protein
MNVSVSKIKRFIKKLFEFLEENSSVEIMFPKENNCNSAEDEVYENMLKKIKQIFKYIINSLKEPSSVEILFPKEENCKFTEKGNKQNK